MTSYIASIAIATMLTDDPWPLERQDRYGTGQAIMGLANDEYSTPWRHIEYGGGFISSHGPSFAADGTAYFGRWVDNTLRRFDPYSGAITGTVAMGNFVASTPAIGQNRIFASTDNSQGDVFAINRTGLFFDWVNNTGYISGSPNLGPEGDVVYARLNGEVSRINEANGAPVWTKTGYSNPEGTVVFTRDDASVIVSHGNSISALRWSDGQQLWTYNSGSKTGGSAVAPDGTIVFGNESGRVIGVGSDGSLKWTRFTADKIDSAPAFGTNGEVYIGSHDWAVYAFRVSDGLPLWNYLTNHWIATPPTVDNNGRIYIQNRLGYLYCLAPDGNLIWTQRIGGDPRGPMTFDGDGTLYVAYAGANPGGLVSIRLDSPKLLFDLTSINDGITPTGGPSELEEEDMDPLSLLSGDSGLLATEIVAEFEAHTPKRDLSTIRMETNVKLLGVDHVIFLPEIFNHSTGVWQSVPARVKLIRDSAQSFNLSFMGPATNAVEPGTNLVKVRFRCYRYDRPTSQWGIEVDELTGSTVPVF